MYEGGETRKMNKKGFTLIELLVVIGILAILTAVVLVAVNPGRQLAQARDTARRADINALLTAVTAFDADPNATGSLPAMIPCVDGSGNPQSNVIADASVANSVDLRPALVPLYIADLPVDPSDGTEWDAAAGTYNTAYNICLSSVTPPRYRVVTTSEMTGAEITVER